MNEIFLNKGERKIKLNKKGSRNHFLKPFCCGSKWIRTKDPPDCIGMH